MRKRTALIICESAIAVLALTACQGGKVESESNLTAAAKVSIEKGDLRTATVQLKDALQKYPNSSEARLLLGQSLYKSGNYSAAEIELRKALDLGQPISIVAPILAHLMLDAGAEKRLVEEFDTVDFPEAAGYLDFLTSLAIANGRLGKTKRSEDLIVAALDINPEFVPAKLIDVRLRWGRGDIDSALKALEGVLSKDPKSPEALELLGEIRLYGKGDVRSAADAFQQSLLEQPKNLPIQRLLIGLYYLRGDLPAASKQIAALKVAYPSHPETKFFEAEEAFLKSDYKNARDLLQTLLKTAPDNSRFLLLSGMVELRLNSLVQAETQLKKALTGAPGLQLAGRFLAETYLRMGQSAKAFDTLRPFVEKESADAESLSVAADALVQLGDLNGAEVLYRRASTKQPDKTGIRTALAMIDVAKGNSQTAIVELQSIATKEKGTFADYALVVARIRRNEFDEALKAVDALEIKLPDKPMPAELRGKIKLLKKDYAGARESFERALQKDQIYFPAISGLAELDFKENHPELAVKRFRELLKTEPKHWNAMVALADLQITAGAPSEEIIQQLKEAVKVAPLEPAPVVSLMRYLLNIQDPKAAIAVGQSALATQPESVDILLALAQSQAAVGESEQAVNLLNKAVALAPRSTAPLLLLADLYGTSNQLSSAERSMKIALEIAPQDLSVIRAAAALALKAKKPEEAIKLARAVQKRNPKDSTGYFLEGDVLADLGRWDDAQVLYRRMLQLPAPGAAPMRLHFALSAGKKSSEASAFATDWMRQHPNDSAFLFYLGSGSLARNDLVLAEKQFLDVVRIDPNNALAMNNVAWLRMKQNKAGALAIAQRAAEIAPYNASILDTLSQALAADGQLPKATEIAKKAVSLSPQAYAYRLNLAKLYLKTNEIGKAKTELQQLSRAGDKFTEQLEVSNLLKGL